MCSSLYVAPIPEPTSNMHQIMDVKDVTLNHCHKALNISVHKSLPMQPVLTEL
jgi:hypothetical protein